MSEYPTGLVRTHRLIDGRSVTIRPIRAEDAAHVSEFLAATSEESRYSRFHQWVHAPSSAMIHFLTDVDYDRHMALVCAFDHDGREELVGEARYVANPGGASCDFGILIEDAWRKTGIAGLLMDALIRAARERGFASMEGLVLASNAPMLRFAHALGFDVEPMEGDLGSIRIVMNLQRPAGAPDDPSAARIARSP
jgi:acetyltransferase